MGIRIIDVAVIHNDYEDFSTKVVHHIQFL